MERLTLLFAELERLTGVADIAYHQIRDGHLSPVSKTKTDHLGVEKWKAVHAKGPVYIEQDKLLSGLMKTRQTAIVQDVKNDPISSSEFFLFGIDSIMVIPVILAKQEQIEGIIVVGSIGKLHHFTEEEIQRAEQFVQEYKDIFENELEETESK